MSDPLQQLTEDAESWRRGWNREAARVRPRRVRTAVARWGRAVLGWAARPARLIPGVAALGCAVAGSWLLWGVGVALLVAAALFLLVDAQTPRG